MCCLFVNCYNNSNRFRMESSADVAHFESLVAQLTDGNSSSEDCIDYVDWSNRIDIADLQRISRGCREVGPFARAALDDDGLQLLGNMRRRIGVCIVLHCDYIVPRMTAL
jgi:hypothetical protein